MSLIGRFEHIGRHEGWLVANEMHDLGNGRFQILKYERTPICSDPEPSEWTYLLDNGTVRWESNNSLLSASVVRDFDIDKTPGFDPARHDEAYHRELERMLAAYRKAQPSAPSDEQRFEARAAHGPGVTILDVKTGRRFRT